MLPIQKSTTKVWPDIQVRDTMAKAGRIVLNFHFQRMLQNEAGTRLGEDAEALHDMRVATRRMRAAFRVFKPYYRTVVTKRHRKGLKITGRILGTVRDWDVLIEKTRTYQDSLTPEAQSDLGFLVECWSRAREADREQLLAYLDSESYREFKYSFSEFVHLLGDELLDLHPPTWSVYEEAPSLILSRYERVLTHEEIFPHPVLEQLHALRIDFKRFRYTVEFFRMTLGETTDFCINELKVLQDHLGDLNDARVAVQRIQQFLGSPDESVAAKVTGEKFLQVKEAELYQLVATFPQAWARFRQPEFRQNLEKGLKLLRYPV